VPDWNQGPQTTFDYRDDRDSHLHEPRYLYHASGDTSVSVIDLGDEKLLGLRGFVVDQIEELGSPWTEDQSLRSYQTLSYLTNIKLMCLISASRNNPIYPSEQRRAEAIWRIPVADIKRVVDPRGDICNARATPDCGEAFQNILASEERRQELGYVSPELRAELSKITEDEQSNGATHYRGVMATLRKKRPFLTTLGYVGLGPVFAKAGDKVVVFHGAAIPFILRPAEEGMHRLLGEAYCDGVMDGEIVNERDAETFVLT
jgi:hypothetical protein